MKLIKEKKIYTGDGVIENGYIRFDEKIEEVGDMIGFEPKEDDLEVNCAGTMVVPGFIDIHSHGGYGKDNMDATPDEIDEMVKQMTKQEGITTYFCTTMTQTYENIEKAMQNIHDAAQKNPVIKGIHVEGPFISTVFKGAQDPSYIKKPDENTLEKWNEFSTYIDGNAVCARYNGVITGVELEAGDKISTGTSLVTLYDMDEVTMTVTVDEDDMTDISLGSAANIALTAYREDIFTAKVTAIGDATSDSSGNITYDVTVTLEGDVSGLFQGMTGDVTFVTEQTEEVLYVSRRAIITEDDKTYVKVKTADGSIVKKEITTGLSDDSNVEISGDIAEGNIVLIESSITK